MQIYLSSGFREENPKLQSKESKAHLTTIKET